MMLVRFLLCLLIAIPGHAMARTGDAANVAQATSGAVAAGPVMAVQPRDSWQVRVMRAAQRLCQGGPLRDGLAGSVRVRFFPESGLRADRVPVFHPFDPALDAKPFLAAPAAAVLADGGAVARPWRAPASEFADGSAAAMASGDRHELEEGAP